MDKFDAIIIGTIELAQSEALKRKHAYITTHHFLYALIKHPKSTASQHLKGELNAVSQMLESLPSVGNINLKELKIDPKMQEWFTMASSSALESGRDKVFEVDFLKYLNRFYPHIKLNIPEDASGAKEQPEFLENLNKLASSGKLDPVIGRSSEIRKVMEILCRRTKNNPVLVGAAGVGKTAIVEGLADLIVKNKVPDIIQGRTIYSLQIGSLMAGTKFRGEFEEKIQSLLGFLKDKGREAVLFIDEVHLLIGAGKTEGAIDAANLLKPALARGELNCIGATTLTEYKKYIEADSALERRFGKVLVDAPSVEDTIQILMGLKEKMEIHHGVDITNDAILAAATLSDQYITDRNLPDKAIDLIDEAAAGLKLSADSPPPKMQELESLIRSKKILASAQENNVDLKKEIENLEKEFSVQREVWEKSVLGLKKAAQLKKKLDEAQFEFQKKSSAGDYAEASRLKYTIIRDLTKELSKIKVSWELSKHDIGSVINQATGIPLERILSDRQAHILKLGQFLNENVLGQKLALNEIADSLIASHAGLTDQSRPLGSFLLLGPSGVGKTETAKKLALFLFHDEKNMVRIDLSEYRESHAVAKLIGAPPGYVGYDQGGILTEAVRRKPYSVLLFDEIEKAHMDFGDILLQILDDGILGDAQGRSINFKNTVIIVTSNLDNYESFLKPELIGRFDAILRYQSLTKEVVRSLVYRELDVLNKKLLPRKTNFELSEDMTNKIIELGFDERYGARPLKNSFNRLVIKPVSKFIMEHGFTPGHYLIDVKNQQVIFTKTEAKKDINLLAT